MGVVIIWVCKKCAVVIRTNEGKHPSQYSKECMGSNEPHDWQPTQVQGKWVDVWKEH